MTVLSRALLLGAALLLASSLPEAGSPGSATAQTTAGGRVLGSSRGQVAWLDLVAPRPTPVTQLIRPAYPADVAGGAGVPFAVASVVSDLTGSGAFGGDLLLINLQTSATRTLLRCESDSESLDLPAVWSDGSAILYQRSNLRVAVPMPGQAQPQFQSRVEQVDPASGNPIVLLQDARYPGPAPDGAHFAFVRSTDGGAAIFTHSLSDGSDQQLVAPGQFLALAYPRFSPDGQSVAFAAISLLSPVGRVNPAPAIGHTVTDSSPFRPGSDQAMATMVGNSLPGHKDVSGTDAKATFGLGGGVLRWLGTWPVLAHGFPWEVWMVNADGTALRQIQDVQDDDPSLTWSPDGSQLLIYGGWGSYVVDTRSGTSASLPFLAGYGAVAWLPD